MARASLFYAERPKPPASLTSEQHGHTTDDMALEKGTAEKGVQDAAHTCPGEAPLTGGERAMAAKATGTRHFQQQEYHRAALNYSLALRLLDAASPAAAAILSNRSGAHSKLGQWEKALEDAERAIRLNGTCAKFWCRKGAALLGMGQAGEAVKAYKKASQVEPGYAGAREGLAATKEAIRDGQRRYEEMWGQSSTL
jgi:tetratricopeptide (TPR) repeat protein